MRPEHQKTEMASTEVAATEATSASSQRTLWYRVLDLKELLGEHPERTHLYAELALTYQDLGRWREALEWWERYLSAEPSGPAAERGWAEWRQLKGRYLAELRRLLAELRDPSVAVRRKAAWQLSACHDPATTPSLQAALYDPDSEVRGLAMCALKRIKDELWREEQQRQRRRGRQTPSFPVS
jgi:tetratricopeptide (TPR) repeat protein